MWRQLAILAALGCGSSAPSPATTPEPVTDPSVAATPAATALPHGPSASDPAPRAQASGNRCDSAPVDELAIDGLLDDWRGMRVVARIGAPADGAIELRCAWDGASLALVLDIKDDRVVRVKGGHEDRVTIALRAGGKPLTVTVLPGNQMAKAKITKPAQVEAADSLQPEGFSVELAIPARVIPGYSPSTPAFDLSVVFHDSDAATGGDTTPLAIERPIELGDRQDLFADFLAAVRLRKTDITLDTLVDVDPDRKGKERLVAGGTVIGVLTDRFAYVALPAQSAADVVKVELLPLGKHGHQVIAARVRQRGNGGSRDLLMLWTVWSGQLQPLVNVEIRKQLGTNVLESTYTVARGKKGAELVVEPGSAVGFTAQTWNDVPAGDADPIVVPWDATKRGIAYRLVGAEIQRRDLPKPKRR